MQNLLTNIKKCKKRKKIVVKFKLIVVRSIRVRIK